VTLVYLAAAWLLGIVAGALAGEVWWPGAAAIGVAGLAAAALERRPQLAVIGLLAAGLFAGGAVRYDVTVPPSEPAGVARYNDTGLVRVRALVTDEPEVRGRSQRVRLEVREVFVDGSWQAESGGVLLRRGLFPRHDYGDLLELEGELETPPTFPDFDYLDTLAREGIGSLLAYPEVRTIATGRGNDVLQEVHTTRYRLGDALARALPEPQAALAQGILLGQRSAIPADLSADMNATGTSHLIAISGQNVSLVAGLVISTLAWLIGRRQAAVVALLTIIGYTALTGASPTVVRAAIMGGLLVTATLVGRPASAATSIALAAALMTGLEPQVAHDVSFQLSFASILGIVYLAPPLHGRGVELAQRWGVDAESGGLAGSVVESTAVTAGAVLATLPLIALYFGRISVVALAPNLLLVPAFPLIMGAAALTAIAGVAWAPLGQAAGFVAWGLLTYMIGIARFFAGVPVASAEIDGFGRGHAAGAYIALAAITWLLHGRRRALTADDGVRPRLVTLHVRRVWLLAGGLAVAAAIAWWAALDGNDGRLTVSVLDVGQGDAILIQTPDGRNVLIDGGASGQAVTSALGEELPFWERTIDLVVLTHPQEDHLAGLIDVLERYDVRQVLATPVEADTALYREWRSLIREDAIPYHEARVGEAVDLGDGAALRVLGPRAEAVASGDVNDTSLVLRLEWRQASFLLAGDIEAVGERALLASHADVQSTVLKVAHHGSQTSSSPAFVSAVRPAVAVVSVGANNPFGHPSPAVLERLDGSLVLRTDERGTVRLSTDGEHVRVETER
jgi:competence protein ComEC